MPEVSADDLSPTIGDRLQAWHVKPRQILSGSELNGLNAKSNLQGALQRVNRDIMNHLGMLSA
jgi:hypothetical protein